MNRILQWRVFEIGLVSGAIVYLLNLIINLSAWAPWLSVTGDPLGPDWPVLTELLIYLSSGWLFVLGYALFYKSLPSGGFYRGLYYGFWIWLVGAGPAVFYLFLGGSLTSDGLVILWIKGAVISLIFGLLTSWLYRPLKPKDGA